ncbi:MAG: hypothetical protein Q9O62_07940 [Ardenticatenia bacterium]|nr:hypothetical protein [Ardenticatenia bacterium]
MLWEPLTAEEARELAEQAAARFRAAVETDKSQQPGLPLAGAGLSPAG